MLVAGSVCTRQLSLTAQLQVWRWSQQYYSQLKAEPLPEMADLIQWLKEHIPEDDNYASVTRVSHGDFR